MKSSGQPEARALEDEAERVECGDDNFPQDPKGSRIFEAEVWDDLLLSLIRVEATLAVSAKLEQLKLL
uniref:Uncharacterized protein n=1 Tax=Romanomermis culicivorax TaxID=13658 RepID=A0A915IU12_ROMCU